LYSTRPAWNATHTYIAFHIKSVNYSLKQIILPTKENQEKNKQQKITF